MAFKQIKCPYRIGDPDRIPFYYVYSDPVIKEVYGIKYEFYTTFPNQSVIAVNPSGDVVTECVTVNGAVNHIRSQWHED